MRNRKRSGSAPVFSREAPELYRSRGLALIFAAPYSLPDNHLCLYGDLRNTPHHSHCKKQTLGSHFTRCVCLSVCLGARLDGPSQNLKVTAFDLSSSHVSFTYHLLVKLPLDKSISLNVEIYPSLLRRHSLGKTEPTKLRLPCKQSIVTVRLW